jgi:hypothetical protein
LANYRRDTWMSPIQQIRQPSIRVIDFVLRGKDSGAGPVYQ